MVKKNELIRRATALRLQGRSFKSVASILGISASTSYLWLKNVSLSEKSLAKLQLSRQEGRKKGWDTNRERRLARDSAILLQAEKTLSHIQYSKDHLKLFCSLLYWGEGSKTKTEICFTNSNPDMVRTFLVLFRRSFIIMEHKLSATLHLHGYHNRDVQVRFWSRITGIPKKRIFVYNKHNSGKNTRLNYPGCISVKYGDVRIFKEVEYLYKLFALKHGGIV
jgi:hypothetical protein